MASSFSPRWLEYFPAGGNVPSLEAWLEKLDEADVVVALPAHRYGSVPDGPGNADGKHITWLECEHARNSGKEVFAFVADPDFEWPETSTKVLRGSSWITVHPRFVPSHVRAYGSRRDLGFRRVGD